jgi:hypothetical protein
MGCLAGSEPNCGFSTKSARLGILRGHALISTSDPNRSCGPVVEQLGRIGNRFMKRTIERIAHRGLVRIFQILQAAIAD